MPAVYTRMPFTATSVTSGFSVKMRTKYCGRNCETAAIVTVKQNIRIIASRTAARTLWLFRAP